MKMSGMFSRKSYLACALTLAMLPLATAMAEDSPAVQGEIRTASGAPYQYSAPLGTSDITPEINQGLGEIVREFSLDGSYKAKSYCPNGDMPNLSPIFYSGTTTLQPSAVNPGFLSLNEYLDAKIEIWIEGNIKQYYTVDFFSKTNNFFFNTCKQGAENILLADFTSGSKGKVTFKIKKPIINGIRIEGQEVAKLYGNMIDGAMSSTPMAIINIEQAVITVPDRCVINHGDPIAIDFQTISGRAKDLTGDNYVVPFDVDVKCEGGSFTSGYYDVRMAIQPATGIASFNSNYLATTGGGIDRSNLGIVVRERTENKTIAPNIFNTIPGFSNNQGTWNLEFAPVANQETVAIPEGDFTSSATIIAQFP